ASAVVLLSLACGLLFVGAYRAWPPRNRPDAESAFCPVMSMELRWTIRPPRGAPDAESDALAPASNTSSPSTPGAPDPGTPAVDPATAVPENPDASTVGDMNASEPAPNRLASNTATQGDHVNDNPADVATIPAETSANSEPGEPVVAVSRSSSLVS